MPGILPMKVIKVGSNAQSRVAQACDRCRSKKIRCDGVTPCCSQCANIGFECIISDKLSRRAFPRGYTESLEERVRLLESEMRELKDLLDAKDEKIDMLSRIHSNPLLDRRPSSTFSLATSATSRTSSVDAPTCKEGMPSLQAFSVLEDEALPVICSAAAACGRSFIDSFRSKLKATHARAPSFKTQVFFDRSSQEVMTPTQHHCQAFPVPSRMASDQMVNLFLQEWSPLFPILHRPAVLRLYADFVADPESVGSRHEIAQLYLIFGIAAASAEWNKHDPTIFESKWQPALDSVVKDVSLSSLQCLLLAELYCIAQRDDERLQKYRAMAAKLSRRLGLHESQKGSSLAPLVTETRKRLFWVLFSLDCFSATILGQPRALIDIDIACEFPHDVNDENIAEEAFLTVLTGESTRVSSALAFIQGTRVVAEILDVVYPASPSRNISLQTIASLSEKLESWFCGLAPHLRLSFMQDKPSTTVVGSRSPFLSLMYHYVRILLHRPLVVSNHGNQASSSLVTLAQSSKHIIQILQLLEERRMSFSFCLNKSHTLIIAGFGLLFQIVNLSRECKLVKEVQRDLQTVTSMLDRGNALGKVEFNAIVTAILHLPSLATKARLEASAKPSIDHSVPAPKDTFRPPPKSQGSYMSPSKTASATRPPIKQESREGRPLTESCLSALQYPGSTDYKNQGNPALSTSEPFFPPRSFPIASNCYGLEPFNLPNLDYLDFGGQPATSKGRKETTIHLNMTGAGTNLQQTLDSAFPPQDMFSYISDHPSDSKASEWSSDVRALSADANAPWTQAAQSISDEDLTSDEELNSCGANGHFPSTPFRSEGDLTALDGFGGNFAL